METSTHQVQGPPRDYKLHCSLVLAVTVKIFDGIHPHFLCVPAFLARSITAELIESLVHLHLPRSDTFFRVES